MRDGHTLSRARRERRCSYELVVVALAVQQIKTAVLSAAEQRDVLHRRVAVVAATNTSQLYLILPTPKCGVPPRDLPDDDDVLSRR